MSQASKKYSSKASAKRAMKNKSNYLHGGGNSGEINFGTIWVEGNTLYASSSYWQKSTLQDFLDGKRELVQ